MKEMELYKAALPWQPDKKADTLVVHCSAYDFRPYFAEFIEKQLNLKNYDLLSVPGGIQVLTLADFMPKFEALMRRWIHFLVKNHRLQKIVIIGHEECSWYKDFRFGPVHIDLRDRQIKDLASVAEMLRSSLEISVDVYFAQPKDGKVIFSQIS